MVRNGVDHNGPLESRTTPVHNPPMADIQFKVRLPSDLKEKLEQTAGAAGRSLTAEIVYRLERSFQYLDIEGPLGPLDADTEDSAATMARIIAGVIQRLKNESVNEDGTTATIRQTLDRIKAKQGKGKL